MLPHVITYNAAISACEQAQQWHQVLGEGAAPRLLPDGITNNAAISAKAMPWQWHQALGLYAKEP